MVVDGWSFYLCWLGAERNRILNYGYPASRTSLCLWHIGMDADMADGARIYFFMSKSIRNVEAQRIWQPTAANWESRIKTDGYGSIGEYGQPKSGSYSINIIRSHQLQSATPVICRKTYESAMSFLSVILCDVKRSACHPLYQRYTWNTVRWEGIRDASNFLCLLIFT